MQNSTTLNKVIFDIRGQICPSALLTTLREINSIKKELQNGEAVLQVLTDNRDTTGTIPNAVKSMGYESIVEKKERHYEITISNKNK